MTKSISSSPIKGDNGTDRLEGRLRYPRSSSTCQNDTYRASSNDKSTFIGIESNTENGSTGGKSQRIKSEPNTHNERGNKVPINMPAQPPIEPIATNYGDNHSNNNVQSQFLNSENNDSYVPLKIVINKKTGTIKKETNNTHFKEGNSINETEFRNNPTISRPFVDYRQNIDQPRRSDKELNIKAEPRSASDRRQELLQQLQDVESSITKKRNQIFY